MSNYPSFLCILNCSNIDYTESKAPLEECDVYEKRNTIDDQQFTRVTVSSALNPRRAVCYVTLVLLGVMVPRMVSTVRTKPGVMVAELTEYCSTVGGAVGALFSIGKDRKRESAGG